MIIFEICRCCGSRCLVGCKLIPLVCPAFLLWLLRSGLMGRVFVMVRLCVVGRGGGEQAAEGISMRPVKRSNQPTAGVGPVG